MSAFRFSLRRIRDLRREEEKACARTLQEARLRAEEAEEARRTLEAIRLSGRERLARAHAAGGPIGRLHPLEFLLSRMEEHLAEAEFRCREAEERVAASLHRFTEAFRLRSTLDRLRERRFQEWRTDELRREQKELDEVALRRHGRSGAEPVGRREEP